MQRVSRENARAQVFQWVGPVIAAILVGWVILLLAFGFDLGSGTLYVFGAVWTAAWVVIPAFLLRWGVHGREVFVSDLSERGFRSGLFGRGELVDWQEVSGIAFSGHRVAFGPVSKWFFNAGIHVATDDGKKYNFRFGCYGDPRAVAADFLAHLTRSNTGYQDEAFVASCKAAPGQIEYSEDIWERFCRESVAEPRNLNRTFLALWWGVLRYGVLPVLLSFLVTFALLEIGMLSYELVLKNWITSPLLVLALIALPLGLTGRTLLRYLDLLVLARRSPPVDAEVSL